MRPSYRRAIEPDPVVHMIILAFRSDESTYLTTTITFTLTESKRISDRTVKRKASFSDIILLTSDNKAKRPNI